MPAVQALQRALILIDSNAPCPERAYLHDVALVAMARIYLSAAVRRDENDMPTADTSKLSAAVKYYEPLDPGSPLFADAAAELATAYDLASDAQHALPLARWLSSTASSSEHAAEADVIRATTALASCDYAGARTVVGQLRTRATSLQGHLRALVASTEAARRDDAWLALVLAARAGGGLEADAATEIARPQRDLSRSIVYLARIDAEARMTPPGGRAAIDAERARTLATIARIVRTRLVATIDRLGLRLEDARRLDKLQPLPRPAGPRRRSPG